ncbi:ABC transporter permease [Wenjunlia vitaminophila]|uniref:Histidine/lysine/arginine/ornithine transport system permease protein HisM n=1 Tax=Wenjunlia vitaminophila TaxID=76728 RepID=A0A0T6LME1_WENVI|nr:amino acid ABC transporter permease [Wenjunlia vitaminophila]KRV47157.1 ABC transporter permease [Wenjunlia vitaminophila]
MTVPTDKEPSATPAAPPPSPEAIVAIPVRHYGRWISAVVALSVLGLIGYAFSQGDVNYGAIPDYFFNDQILRGVRNTVWLTFLAMLLGVGLGVVLAVMRLSKNPVNSALAWFYIWFFRGTPVYVQLLVWINLGIVFKTINLGFYQDEWADFMTPFLAALLGLGLNEAAYMAEIVRAGIQSVDEGQTEASHALGMSHGKTLRRVVLPQAMRVIVPPTGNEFINMLKTTSLVIAVAYFDLLQAAQDVGSESGAAVEMLFLASVWYVILTTVFSIGQYYLERRYARGSARRLPPTPFQRVRANLRSLRRPEVAK